MRHALQASLRGTVHVTANLWRRAVSTSCVAADQRYIYFKVKGETAYAAERVDSDLPLPLLQEAMARKLPSMRDVDPRSLQLRKRLENKHFSSPLDADLTVAAAGLTSGSHVEVEVKLPGVYVCFPSRRRCRRPRNTWASTIARVCSANAAARFYCDAHRFNSSSPFCSAALERDDATQDEVEKELSSKATQAIQAARAHRGLLQAARVLEHLHGGYTVAEAKADGVLVPPEIANDSAPLTVGLFTLPVLDRKIMETKPKSELYAHALVYTTARVWMRRLAEHNRR